MRLDGSFRATPRTSVPLSAKLMVGAILVAVIGGAVAFAALALWVVSLVLLVVIVAGLFAWAMMRFRRWQAMRGGRTVGPFSG